MGLLIGLTCLTGVGGLFLGGVFGVFIGGQSRQSEAMLLSFSAGAMIALVCFELLHEAMETGVSPVLIAGTALLGALLVTFLDYMVDKRSGHSQDFITCEDCDEEFEHDRMHTHCDAYEDQGSCQQELQVPQGSGKSHTSQTNHAFQGEGRAEGCDSQSGSVPEHHHKRASHLQLFVAGLVMAAAVAIHNFPEGMSIGAIYAGEKGVVSGALLMLFLSIVLHNIPEGVAISVPLMTGGMNRFRAVGVAALSGVPTVLGALAGFGLGDMGPIGLALSLSFAAGTLLYVVFGEVMPQAINLYCSRKTAFSAILGLCIGMLILAGHIH